jgi:hypothetical protein
MGEGHEMAMRTKGRGKKGRKIVKKWKKWQ